MTLQVGIRPTSDLPPLFDLSCRCIFSMSLAELAFPRTGAILLWKPALSHRVSSNHTPKAGRIRVREEKGQIMLGGAAKPRLAARDQ